MTSPSVEITAPVARSQGAIGSAVADIRAGWRQRAVWGALAYRDVVAQYRRSIIGPFWITIQMAAMVLGIALIYSSLFQTDFVTFLPYVALGFLVWNLMVGMIVGSANTYIGNAGYIRSMALPLSTYAFRMVASQVWTFLHNVLPVALLLLLLRIVPSPWAIIEVPAALLLLVVNGLALGLWLGPLSARYRDIPPLVASMVQLLMFVTPVFWDPTTGVTRAAVAWNPLAYFLDLVRYPLLDRPTGLTMWAVALVLTLVNVIAGLVVFGRSRRWIAHWVA